MKRISAILILKFLFAGFIYSNPTELIRLSLYEAYITGNEADWIRSMNKLHDHYIKTKDINTLYELTRAQYGYMGLMIEKGENEKAKKLLPKADKNITKLINHNPEWPEAHALKAGIYGFKIILYPNYTVYYGPKGKNSVKKAGALNGNSPPVVVEMANYKYHTPNLLGGDIDDAIKYYKKAIQLFEQKGLKDINWQYMNTMAWLAIAYDKKGDTKAALNVLKSILNQEPDFTWVRDELYPQILANNPITKSYIKE